ncbi:MAG: universal stress protein [Acidimicrobiia bacterium]|nr:universal stress protein [Acidimicrobiia bacterium]
MSVHTITVPIDGSQFSSLAVQPAGVLARRAGASITLVGVATDGDAKTMRAHVRDASRLAPVGVEVDEQVIVGPDGVGVLLERVSDAATVVCAASHDHARATAAILGSIGSRLIARATRPLFVVGPKVDVGAFGDDVVVAVDGRRNPDPLLGAAASVAEALGAGIRIVTVFEPVLADVRRPQHYTRTHGPSYEVDAYLSDVSRRLPLGSARVQRVGIADPVGVTVGLAEHLDAAPALALVVGGGRGAHHLGPGAVHDLVRRLPVPLLVVPAAPAEPAWISEAEAAGILAKPER